MGLRGAARRSPLKIHLGAFLQLSQAGGSQGLLNDIKAEAVPILGSDLQHEAQPVNQCRSLWGKSPAARGTACEHSLAQSVRSVLQQEETFREQSPAHSVGTRGDTATALEFMVRQVPTTCHSFASSRT